MLIDKIKNKYIFTAVDPHFGVKPREILRYASDHGQFACLTKVNPEGPEPIDYLNFAKADIHRGDPGGLINAVSNSKRAIHLLIECFLEILGLQPIYKKTNFPYKLEVIDKIGAFPTYIISRLNKKRNLVEHEYLTVDKKDAIEFVEIAELLLMVCYPFLKTMILSVHVGLKGDDQDIEWVLDPERSEITINECFNSKYIDSEYGKIYYDFSKVESDRKVVKTIKLRKNNIDIWVPYLSTLLYCTKKFIYSEPFISDDEIEERLVILIRG